MRGIPEIIKDCGEIIIPENKTTNFKNLNFEYGLEPPNIEDLYKSILKIINNKNSYKNNILNSLKILPSSSLNAYHKLLSNLS